MSGFGLSSALAAQVVRPPATSRVATSTAAEGVSGLLTLGKQATIWNSATGAIRVAWNSTATATSQVSLTTSFYLATGARFDFVPQANTDQYVYIQADAGAGAECWIWTSSP